MAKGYMKAYEMTREDLLLSAQYCRGIAASTTDEKVKERYTKLAEEYENRAKRLSR